MTTKKEFDFHNGEVYVDPEKKNMMFEDPLKPGVICFLDVFHMEIAFYSKNRVPDLSKWKKLVSPVKAGRPKRKVKK